MTKWTEVSPRQTKFNENKDAIIIQLIWMQFLLFACSPNDNPPLNKSKLSKIRHIDFLILLSLLIALVFFLIFQNQQLKQKINNRLLDQIIQQLLQQRLSPLLKQLQELKTFISEENSKILQKQDENKKLILTIGRELGLPLLKNREQHTKMEQEGYQKYEGETYEVIEIYHVNSEESQSQEDDSDSSSESYIQSIIQQGKGQQMQTPANYQCSYLAYLRNGQPVRHKYFFTKYKSQAQYFINEKSIKNSKVNFSSFIEIAKESIQYAEHYQEIKSLLTFGGNCLLIVGFLGGLFMVISFILNKRNRTKQPNSLLKMMLKKVNQVAKKRQIPKSQKQILYQ